MDEITPKNLEDDIPSKYLERFGTISKETWKHEDFRKKVVEICEEHQNAHDFVKKIEGVIDESLKREAFIEKTKSIAFNVVKDYVDKSRVNTIFWVATLVVATVVGLFLQKFLEIF